MLQRAASQGTSISRQSTTIPTVLPTSAVIFTPASVPPTPTVTHPPVPTLSTVIITSVLAPMPPTMISSTALGLPTAVYTTITTATLLTTYPTSAPGFSAFNTLQSSAPGSATSIIMPDASRGFPHSSSISRLSSARATASSVPSTSPSQHKSKSNVGKYVGYAIGAVFFLTLVSSFISAYRKHRKYVRKRPRGSIYIGTRLADGQNSPQKRSMAQVLMHSVSNTSFDAYALSNTPPASPASVFLPSSAHSGSQHSHLDLYRGRGFSPSPLPVRPLPPTPSPKYTMHEEEPVFFPRVLPSVAADPREYSQFGILSSDVQVPDPRWHLGGNR